MFESDFADLNHRRAVRVYLHVAETLSALGRGWETQPKCGCSLLGFLFSEYSVFFLNTGGLCAIYIYCLGDCTIM